MSGPKVVRIVTREEIIAICRGRIEAVRQLMEEWRRYAKRYDALSPEAAADVDARFRALEQLFESERWLNVQKRAPEIMAFLKHDMERIREDAIGAAARARAKRRRIAQSAHTIALALRQAGKPVPDDLARAARTAYGASDEELVSLQSALGRAMMGLAPTGGDFQSSKHQQELAGRLSDGASIKSVSQWQAEQQASRESEKGMRLDRLMSEIELFEDKDALGKFLQRARTIDAELDIGRRNLLVDSLTIDLAAYCRRHREEDAQLAAMREVGVELGQIPSEQARRLAQQLGAAVAVRDIQAARGLHQEALSLIAEETRLRAAPARRAAILKGLAALGYEVRQTMATALTQSGRVVVCKPSMSEYGVEISGPANAERLQMRLVGFGQPGAARDAAHDKDMETIWCADFARLEALLGAAGDKILINKALAAGATPIKVVERDLPAETETAEHAPKLRSRTIPGLS